MIRREDLERQVRTPVAIVSLALVVVLLGLCVVLVLRERAATADDRAEAEATRVAERRIVQVTTYDPEAGERADAWLADGATTSFAREFRRASQPTRAAAEQLGASARGSVTASAATRDDDGSVDVLLFVDQTLTRPGARQSVERSRVVVRMVERDGRWLVDDVTRR